ncbi:hypothetical protein GQ472_00130 [archaeon]|nr:hypothetical protein [archaeon]
MNKQAELRIFTIAKESKTTFKKILTLPLYLSDIDSFAMHIYKKCGSHLFHIEFKSSYGRWLKLCSIRIKRTKKTGLKYTFSDIDDSNRLRLFLEKNRKPRDKLKLAENISTVKPKIREGKNRDDFYYG